MARRLGAVAAAVIALLVPAAADAITLAVVDDTYTDLRSPRTLFGARPIVMVTADRRLGYARFDLSALPDDLSPFEVRKATLRFYVEDVAQPGRVSVHPVLEDWSERTLSAATALPFGAMVGQFQIRAEANDKFVHLDVSEVVRAWVEARRTNFGLLLRLDRGSITINANESRRMSHPMVIEVAIN
jgi:hypothetical protein